MGSATASDALPGFTGGTVGASETGAARYTLPTPVEEEILAAVRETPWPRRSRSRSGAHRGGRHAVPWPCHRHDGGAPPHAGAQRNTRPRVGGPSLLGVDILPGQRGDAQRPAQGLQVRRHVGRHHTRRLLGRRLPPARARRQARLQECVRALRQPGDPRDGTVRGRAYLHRRLHSHSDGVPRRAPRAAAAPPQHPADKSGRHLQVGLRQGHRRAPRFAARDGQRPQVPTLVLGTAGPHRRPRSGIVRHGRRL